MNEPYQRIEDNLVHAPDLDRVIRAVEREREIRIGMARTGQGRVIVAEFLDAQAAMDDEAVLDLTEGQPTTLVDALRRYIAELEKQYELSMQQEGAENYRSRVVGELMTLLDYPWPEDERRISLHNPHYGLMLHFAEGEDGALEIRMGNNRYLVCTVPSGIQGWDARLAREVAETVYRATLARVIPDRNHDVRLTGAEARDLCQWLTQPRGATRIGNRLTAETYGHDVVIRTRPYSHQSIRDKSLGS